jgi:hypothetical protein
VAAWVNARRHNNKLIAGLDIDIEPKPPSVMRAEAGDATIPNLDALAFGCGRERPQIAIGEQFLDGYDASPKLHQSCRTADARAQNRANRCIS